MEYEEIVMSLMETPLHSVYRSPFIVPPGEILEEKINEMGMDIENVADRLGMSSEGVIQLFKGTIPLTSALADKLESLTEIPADYWNRAEESYRKKLSALSRAVESD